VSDLTLFDAPAGRVRHTDPRSSVIAAQKQRGGAEQAILDVLTVYGPMHADAICAHRPTIYPPTLRSALARLNKNDRIVWTGDHADSDRGCPQMVWARVEGDS
jgi:hypothetical protein